MRGLFRRQRAAPASRDADPGGQESRLIAGFCRHYGLQFRRPELLRLALTHRSYLSVTGRGSRESNERLEFLGDSVLGLVTSEFLYREHPTEHEGQLTKTKSLLVSKAILSRRALAMGLGRFVLMSHSEVESGGRQRLSILADAFEAVVGAIYLDQGFDAARDFITRWLLSDSREIVADKRHTNYKSHLQEFVQSTYRTHPVYRIRSQMGPDHSKQFHVEVLVSRRLLGAGKGRNKKDAEQAAARNALEQVEGRNRERGASARSGGTEVAGGSREGRRGQRRGRRGGRDRGGAEAEPPRAASAATAEPADEPSRMPARWREEPAPVAEIEPLPPARAEDEFEEVGRPEGPLEERHIDPFAVEGGASVTGSEAADPWPRGAEREEADEPAGRTAADSPTEEPESSPPAPRYGRRGGRSRRGNRGR